ncbi:hypothetical protein DM02DRAFT_669194 [Periconia macrospinosa]|uniref:Chromo domain-containing protein n=1 Tax=Periconia macrospinosa TaxID=97972 RepID=A0A2V1E2K9_9PLEO|nr:hypothetical protein DM02DRAFT_669194 [Periconia macrospinosa]
MAPSSKRKRKSTCTKPKSSKRQKQQEEYYSVKEILKEEDRQGKRFFYVDWEGIDPKTKKPYDPEWIPEEWATEYLVAEWDRRKAKEARESAREANANNDPNTTTGATSPTSSISLQPSPQPPPRRKPPVVDSSPSTARASSPVFERDPSPRARAQSTSLSQTSTDNPTFTKPPNHTSPKVQIPPPRSSFDHDEYEHIASQALFPIGNSSFARSFLQSSQASTHSGSREYRNSGYCRDSEGEDDSEEDIDGSASYIPPTQEVSADNFTQQSYPSSNQLLPGSPPARAHSPSLFSIPETTSDVVLELVEDSQPGAYAQEQILGEEEIPNTFDTFESALQQTLATETETGAEENTENYVDPITSVSQTQHEEVQTSAGAESEVVEPENVSQPIAETSDSIEKDTQGRVDAVASSQQPPHQEVQALVAPEPEVEQTETASGPEEEEARGRDTIETGQQNASLGSIPGSDTVEGASRSVEGAQIGFATNESCPDDSTELEVQPQPVVEAAQDQLRQASEAAAPSPINNQDKQTTVSRNASEQPLATVNRPGASQDNPAEKEGPHSFRQESAIAATPVPLEQTDSVQTSVRSWEYHPESAEQFAQPIPADNYSTTQQDGTPVILPTVEKDYSSPHQLTSRSRHDSSQQSPEVVDLTTTPSPAPPKPPADSLGTLSSNAPPRPRTPTALMEGFEDEVKKVFSEQRSANSFTPTRRLLQSSLFDGSDTRSPSAIPAERPLGSQVQTSLRTVVMASNATVEGEMGLAEQKAESNSAVHETIDSDSIPLISTAPASVDNEELSESDDTESLLNDDLNLQPGEYVVPLPMEGRQVNIYKDEFRNNREVVESFLAEPDKFDDFNKVEDIFRRLLAIETHVDLLYSEPSPTQSDGSDGASSTQCQHQVQWSCENSIKFKFLGLLLDALRNRSMNIVLAIEKDNKRLFTITENFLRGSFVNFKIPSCNTQSDPAKATSNHVVTVISIEENPVVQPPDLVILLDGCFDAEQIRGRKWALNPAKAPIPIIHLVIPRAIGHIERYVSKTLGPRERLHTALATLSQFQEDMLLARALHSHELSPHQVAQAVASFFTSAQQQWPLPLIGSIKDMVEFQSQLSQEAITSPEWQSSSLKRSLGDEQSDPAKRMRFTPQPQDTQTQGQINETTHISDSIPGTAAEVSNLQKQLEDSKQEAKNERNLRRALQKQHKEEHKIWDLQQTRYEEFSRTYGSLKKEKEAAETRLEAAARTEANLREQLTTQKNENTAMQSTLKELQTLHLQSEDEKVAQITRLNQELEAAKESEKRAIKSKASSERDLEYIKDQYQQAQTAAREAQEANEELKKQLDAATRRDPEKIYNLAELHYQRQEKLLGRKEEANLALIEMLKKQLATKEEENVRLKAARGVGAGTRAQSVGARTRPSSRAASPLPGNRDRLANLRNVG